MKTVTIKSRLLGRYDDVSPFIVADKGLELSFSLPEKGGDFVLIAELNGRTEKITVVRGETVILKNLESGELHSEIKHYLHGNLIETYRIEPLILKEADGSLAGTPEIALLTAKNENRKKETEALVKRLAEVEFRAERAEKSLNETSRKITVALLSFAYAEYVGDVQLNAKSLTAEGFISALGFSPQEFTEQELEEIKKKKEIF